MEKVVIVGYARTPFGKIGGYLKDLEATELGSIVIKEAISRAGITPDMVDYSYVGQVLQGGAGQIPSRQATYNAGIPWESPSITVNKVCSSGIIAQQLARNLIRLDEAQIVVAAGMESMTKAPFFTKDLRFGHKMGDVKMKDLMMHDGLWDAFYNHHMAVNGSIGAAEYGISRQEQDEYAVASQIKASEAIQAGRLKNEIVPVEIKSKMITTIVDTDESPRGDTTYESLAKLPPVFSKDGTVTAGNAPGVNDGAGALIYMSESKAKELGLKILATIEGYEQVSADSKYIATVPGLSILKLLNKAGKKIEDIDLFEINEAFAAVALVSAKIAKLDMNKANVDGGAIAYGHPIGATGTRLVMHIIEALKRRGGGYGVCAICSGAAQGDALLLKVE